ncbi:dihydropteroate synthase [Cnuella takakiae]|uniref:dihydropteroate synthase n=1 Tax=Cnuella takakiae TaxID=1302690 RepID=A0A1M4V4D9_9BACT|nr:dihydropteroate synthase [Cnuella takakiae]OLY92712.1 dihydropteroate synthase [Cnuella takakiae]SHE63770.1 dihydropteroate synthase [Cnuella takakiae]
MHSINCKGRLLSFHQPLIMGILNTTPDSFFSDSRASTIDAVLQRAEAMLEQGATILDMGGQSTRPKAERVSPDVEASRVLPAIDAVHRRFPDAVISADTFYASVAREAVAAGASIINDVSAGNIDPEMFATVASLDVPYVLMHMQGDPQTMQQNPQYNDVVLDVFDFLNFKLKALQDLGIKDIIVDPGFGFGKTQRHNFDLLNGIEYFQHLDKPLLIGISRKGMVHRTLGITADAALNGSTVLHTISLMKGAHMLRVHDVKEAMEAIRLMACLKG